MKTFLATALFLFLANAASAQAGKQMVTTEEKTLFTCQQTDGDLWYEVGVVVGKNGHSKLLLVRHDGDTGSTSLVQRHNATVKKNGNSVAFISIEDWVNFSISITTKGKYSYGSFIYSEEGMHEPLKDERMDCFENSTISYEIEAGLEPRMSVGN